MSLPDKPNESLLIVPARPEELPEVLAILDEAAHWLLTRGIAQWESPPPALLQQLLATEVSAGRVFLTWRDLDPRPVATFRIAWQDAVRWGDLEGKAGYLYGLALRSDAHGQSLGDALLDWVKEYFLLHGRRLCRLDCMASNARLRRYYEARGFVFCGETADAGYILARYELRIEPLPLAPRPGGGQ